MITSLKDALGEYLRQRDPDGFSRRMASLLTAWPDLVGPEIAEMTRLLGHKGRVLHLCCFESAAMQEVGFLSFYILEQVNSFIGRSTFDKIHLSLICEQVQSGLVSGKVGEADSLPARPDQLGGLFDRIPADSPVGRAYRAYVKMFDAAGNRTKAEIASQ